jgi:FAD/FMN-containing dehydrogenase
MNRIDVDPDARTARAQAGATWGEFDAATQEHGLAVTGGRFSTTGIAGLTLGSGSGWLERKCGLTADNLLSAEIVTAAGERVTASPDENADLFWGIRGGSGNFGIVTSFVYRLHEVGPIVYGGMLLYPAERATELMRAYRDFVAGAPDEVGGACAVLCAPPEDFVPEPARGKPVFGVIASYVGPVDAGERAFAPLREWGPVLDLCGPIPYAQGLQRLIEPSNPPGRRQYWKAGFLDEMTDEAAETFVSHALDVASPMTASILLPLGGAVARVPEDETVLGHRDAGWNFHILSQWEDPADDERQIGWTRAFDAAMRPHSLEGIYLNFVSEPPENVLDASFGPRSTPGSGA